MTLKLRNTWGWIGGVVTVFVVLANVFAPPTNGVFAVLMGIVVNLLIGIPEVDK